MEGGAAIKESLMPNLRLLHARQTAELSRQALALLSGVSVATIGQSERIGYRPGYGKMRQIAKALKLKVSDLWPDEGDE